MPTQDQDRHQTQRQAKGRGKASYTNRQGEGKGKPQAQAEAQAQSQAKDQTQAKAQDDGQLFCRIHSRQDFRVRQNLLWPESSIFLCWYCCHTFCTVPVFLPSIRNSSASCYYLSGNFCSWNCVKAYYYYTLKDKGKADSIHLISLLAFLTSYRPQYCPSPLTKHSSSCSCLEKFTGIKMPPRKEELVMFGGTMDIETFRSGSLIVKDIDWINKYLVSNHDIGTNMNSITSTKSGRRFVYSFDVVPNSTQVIQHDKTSEIKQQEDIGKPILHKKNTKCKSLFD